MIFIQLLLFCYQKIIKFFEWLITDNTCIDLPGLDGENSKILAKNWMTTKCCIFSKYLICHRDKTKFLDFLENDIGVVFEDTLNESKDEVKNNLICVLEIMYEESHSDFN